MSDPTPEQEAVVDWLEDPNTPTPSAEEAARRFREAGVRSTSHARKIRDKVKAKKPKKGGE